MEQISIHCLYVILTAIAAILLWSKFGARVDEFAYSEIMKVTQEIEAVKASDVVLYNKLLGEWEALIAKERLDFTYISEELITIILKVKGW